MAKLPIIDLSQKSLKAAGTNSWIASCDRVRNALEEYGCFVALYDKVSLELHEAAFDSSAELFDLPFETKVKNTSDKPYFGYFGHNSLMPLHESMGIEGAPNLNKTQRFTDLMWPEGNKSFCEKMHAYSELVSELEQKVKDMVFESYGVKNHLDNHNKAATYLLRLIKYHAPKKNETSIGAYAHTDKSFITVLHQNEINGLEIKTKDGNWIGFEQPSTSAFLVLAGDAFMAWSNGRIHSPEHKVVLNSNKSRYSLVQFSFSNQTIEIPEELVDDEHPLQFKPFEHLGLLRFYSTEEGQKSKCAVRAYCGVH